MKTLWIVLALLALPVAGIVLTLYSQPDDDLYGYVPMTKEEHQQVFDSSDNGYHLFRDAMNQLVSPDKVLQSELDAFREGGELTKNTQTYIETHEATINLAHSGLQYDYVLTPRYDYESSDPNQWWGNVRTLARLMIYDGRRLATEENHALALERYLDTLRLGHSTADQAVLIESMIGIAIEGIALDAIFALVPELDESELDSLIDTLNHIQASTAPFDHILTNERAIMEEIRPLSLIGRLINSRMVDNGTERASLSQDIIVSRLIGIGLRARARVHFLSHGEQPESLDAMLGEGNRPTDPVTGNPFQMVNNKIFSHGDRVIYAPATADSPVDGQAVF